MTVDRCRPYGIPFDRTLVPPDDALTDLACEVRGRLDGLAEDCPAGGPHCWVDDATENSDVRHYRRGRGFHCDECGASAPPDADSR